MPRSHLTMATGEQRGSKLEKPLTIQEWKAAQISGGSIERLCAIVQEEQLANTSSHVWISLASREQIVLQWERLQSSSEPTALPLYGVPFAIKDNIDAEGFLSTAACPTWPSGVATSDAPVVQRLKAAGAILIGKTNLDQFATGLVGTRSPYGAVPNSFDSTRVSGGSSSGSGVAVARGSVAFSLGTDTAGSGRVPAGLNNIVGLKPTRGALSARGVVPACRTLDCVSIFALTVGDAETVLRVAEGYDVEDSFSRLRPDPKAHITAGFGCGTSSARPLLAVCSSPAWFGYLDHRLAYEKALEKARRLGWRLEAVDFAPLFELAELLYFGPWVAERYQAVSTFIEQSAPENMDPVVRGIILAAEKFSAADAFAAEYLRQDLTRQIQLAFERFDGLLLPTTPTFPTLQQVSEKPVEENSRLGTYTNFVNFLDWSALSIPAGFRPDGLPFGITLVANQWQEPQLLRWARHWFSGETRRLGATSATLNEDEASEGELIIEQDVIPIAVVGAHLTGFPLNKDLVSRGAKLSTVTTTSGRYRLFALQSTSGPKKPGLQRVSPSVDGAEIEVEVWNLPSASLASFMATIPHPLTIGRIELKNGSWVHGFLCEPLGLEAAIDITSFGGWRAYNAHMSSQNGASLKGAPKTSISKILVANRGEIALRIIKTIRRMNLLAVAIYSEADADAPHVRAADIARKLDGQSVSETYLNISQIIHHATSAGADAVIPGYGFLAENASFATAVQEAGMTWIGPTATQMSDLGLKHKAREIAVAAQVPTIPGSEGLLNSLDDALREASRIGYPLMLKSTAGGGGIGLSHCADEESLRETFQGVQRQAEANFGNAGVFLERFIQKARHIEVQILGDGTGRVLAAGERDCSLQRRHQKILEESPAIMVPPDVREKMKQAALRLASSVKYRNVGTVEFVYDVESNGFYFLEVNTRLQVEHPVTEMVTGLDLVECMIRIAAGEWDELFASKVGTCVTSGASVEVRLYAENPLHRFKPCSGVITKLGFSSDIRVDTWIEQGTAVTTLYDPMIAKIISFGADRADAVRKLAKALSLTVVEGVDTNLEYLRQIVASEMFHSGHFTTKSLDNFQYISSSFEVVEPGSLTTVQDYPGRVGYWSIGVPPSGPMDSYSFRMANRLVGNSLDSAGLECTLEGPTLKFYCESNVAVTGGDAPVAVDGQPVGMNQVLHIHPGEVLQVGTISHGYRVYIAIQGGIDVPLVMGSRSTFEIGKLGGIDGRKLRTRDFLDICPVDSSELSSRSTYICPPTLIPRQPKATWRIRVIPGPHAAPDYFSSDGFQLLLSSEWKIHHNSNRLGVRLTGPQPEWARSTGGEAGLHPSNIHDSPYSIGSVSFTGDEAVILTSDGPSLGGFVVFCVVATADLWKVGQVRPGDSIQFEAISVDVAMQLESIQEQAIQNLASLENIVPGSLEESVSAEMLADTPPILGKIDRDGQKIQARQAGDRSILLEFGEGNAFDMRQSFAIFAFCDHHQKQPIPGVEEITPGVFTLHVMYERGLSPSVIMSRVTEHVGSYVVPTWVSSRILNLPLAFDDSVCHSAVKRYAATIRQEAPWLPSNIKFLETLNGVEDMSQLLHSTTFLVLGLGDVFMGSPCAIPLDPRHRLFGTKYNPSRSYTPRGAVGIGGQYMCIYATDSPGGYQLVGRTKEIWDSDLVSAERHPTTGEKLTLTPWMFRPFDRIKFYPVTEAELDSKSTPDLVHIEDGKLDLEEYETWLQQNQGSIDARAAERSKSIQSAPFFKQLQRPYIPTVSSSHIPFNDEADRRTLAGTSIDAMMPGRCYRVNIKEGDEVKSGDVLVRFLSSSALLIAFFTDLMYRFA
jgi:urea carboxylase / allophanate hydrolase